MRATSPMPADLASLRPPAVLAHLGHPLRWRLLVALAGGDRGLAELVGLVDAAPGSVAGALSALHRAGLVRHGGPTGVPGEAIYALDLRHLEDCCTEALAILYPREAGDDLPPGPERVGLPQTRVLLLCARDAASGTMAEGILRRMGAGRVAVFRAGVTPTAPHPLAVATLARRGIDIAEQRPTHPALLRGTRFDYAVTLCDCAPDDCLPYVGEAEHLHWPIPDPARTGPEERMAAFGRAADELEWLAGDLVRRVDARRGGVR